MKQLTLVFLVKDDQVLLAMKKRGFGQGRWNGVGGKLEAGETVVQAMIRETEEEIGVTPIEHEQVAEITFNELVNGVVSEMLVTVYLCRRWSGEPVETDEMAPQWFDKQALPYAEMWPDDPFWLPSVIEGKKLTAIFELDQNDTVVNYRIEFL